jgi:peptidoglycan/LPS O-acetylase OafA/YrhL
MVLQKPEAVLNGISTPQLTLWGGLAWYAIAIACTLLLSAAVFKFVEDPCRIISKELVRKYMTRRDSRIQKP